MKSGQKVRMEDVVALSGLSRSTVDRVLNGRAGVRKETAIKVEKALRDLRYRESSLKRHIVDNLEKVEVLLSDGSNPFFHSVSEAFHSIGDMPEMQLFDIKYRGFDIYDHRSLVAALSSVGKDTKFVITGGVDHVEVAQEINRLEDRGVKVFTIVSDVPMSKRTAYVGQDNFAVGRLAGGLMSKMVWRDKRSVAIVLGHLQFRHMLDRQSGFYQTMGMKMPEHQLIQTEAYGASQERAYSIIENLFRGYSDLGGIYIAGGGQPSIVEAIAKFKTPELVVIGHELNAVTKKALEEDIYSVVLSQDPAVLARACIDLIENRPVSTTPGSNVRVYLKENLF